VFWLASALPGLAVASVVGWYFKAAVPSNDGWIYFYASRNAWNLPLKAENFWSEWLHKGSYVSIGLLGLTYHVGPDPITALRVLQFGMFVIAILAFAAICRSIFRNMSGAEATLLTFVFTITPAYLAYFVGVANDFFALALLLAYLALLCARRFLLATLVGTAFAFSKETGFLTYSLTLPLVLVYSLERFGPVGSWPKLTRTAFLLPYFFKGIHLLAHGTGEMGVQIGFCKQASILAFVLSPNLELAEIQNYLFDLFVLNFQWMLLIPVALGTVIFIRRSINDRAALRANTERVNWPALALVLGFFVVQVYVVTRCPVWNNVKYVIQAMPFTFHGVLAQPVRAADAPRACHLRRRRAPVRRLDRAHAGPAVVRFYGT
jgi:hypothetical protein